MAKQKASVFSCVTSPSGFYVDIRATLHTTTFHVFVQVYNKKLYSELM